LEARIEGQLESKLIQVESEASILISNENIDSVNTEVGVLSIEAKTDVVHSVKRRRAAHRRDYTPEVRFFGCFASHVEVTHAISSASRRAARAQLRGDVTEDTIANTICRPLDKPSARI